MIDSRNFELCSPSPSVHSGHPTDKACQRRLAIPAGSYHTRLPCDHKVSNLNKGVLYEPTQRVQVPSTTMQVHA